MDEKSIIIAILATIISLLSLAISFFNFWRDRAKIQVSARYYPIDDGNQYECIGINIINVGRRVLPLGMIVFSNKRHWCGTSLYRKGDTIDDSTNSTLMLGEGESYIAYFSHDKTLINPAELNSPESTPTNFYLLAPNNKKYKVKHSHEIIKYMMEKRGDYFPPIKK